MKASAPLMLLLVAAVAGAAPDPLKALAATKVAHKNATKVAHKNATKVAHKNAAKALSAAAAAPVAHKKAPKPHWRLGDAKEKFEALGKQIENSSLMHRIVQVPEHVHANAIRAVESIASKKGYVRHGQCGQKVSTKGVNARAASLVATRLAVVKHPEAASLLAEAQHPGQDSWSKVGSGEVQKLRDEGKSTIGGVYDTKGQYMEPFVNVLKDGFYEVGCYTDTMLVFKDKYGNNKDQYNDPSGARNSIVKYDEIILKDEQLPMTPIVCFEFCRTLPDMVYFGINNGDKCYCAPYYKAGPGNNKQCDIPCAGDSTKMCGNKDKSSIFEMHLCADTAEKLKDQMLLAKEALDFYFEESVMGNVIGSQMARSGKALEKMGGLSGAPTASYNGVWAQKTSSKLTQAYLPSFKLYKELLEAYEAAHPLLGATFNAAADIVVAENSMRVFLKNQQAVLDAAASMRVQTKLAYPPLDERTFGDDPDPEDTVAKALVAGKADPTFDFRAAAYAFDTKFSSPQSSCKGPVIGAPLVGLGIKECARVCEKTIYPDLCVAFAFYQIAEDTAFEGKGLSDLCFMLKDIKELRTFACTSEDLVQTNVTVAAHGLRGAQSSLAHAEKETAKGRATCMVKMSEVSTGYKPSGEWHQVTRCFSTTEADVPGAYASFKMPDVAQMELDGKDTIAAPP